MQVDTWISVDYREEVHGEDKGKCAIFFGIVHRLRKEEMEEQFNKDAKEGWRFAAAAAGIADERADREDQKHTSEVLVAVDSNMGADVGEKEGPVASIPGNEGRITQAWVNVRGGMRVFLHISGIRKD